MKQMEIEHDGWVIVNGGVILDWTFSCLRKRTIEEFTEISALTWRQWYGKGARCVKATKTISIA